MLKRDYFIYSIKNNLYLARAWNLCVFGILPSTTHDKHMELHGVSTKDGQMHFLNASKELELIEDYVPNKQLFDRDELFTIHPHEFKCVKEETRTTYGLAILNAFLIEYPYDGKVPYHNDIFNKGIANGIAYKALISKIVTVEEHIKFENAACMISCLAQTAIPSASEKSITPNPLVKATKQKLLEEYKNNLHDPAIVTELQNKIIAMDNEYLSGDPSERFFYQDKAAQARLRLHGMVGAEQDFYDEAKISVMTNSLNEGWQVGDLVTMNNTIRRGSIDRSNNTALGGAEVKITGRIFQNYSVVKSVCNTTRGAHVNINEDNYKTFLGRYLLGKENDPLTIDHLKSKIGHMLIIRSPAYCSSDGTTICYKCMGDTVTNSEVGLTSLVNMITSTLMSVFMASMHTSKMMVREYDYESRIS